MRSSVVFRMLAGTRICGLTGRLLGDAAPATGGRPPGAAHQERPLPPLVHKRTYVRWPIWFPGRVGDCSSIAAQFQRALTENLAIAFRHCKKLAISRSTRSKGGAHWSVEATHRRIDSIELCVDVLARDRIVDMQNLTVEPQGHVSMLLKVARIPPLTCKITGPGQSRKDDLRCKDGAVRSKLGHRRRENLPVGRKLIMSSSRLYPIFFLDYV
jgi:hypothetical protein